MVFGSSCPFSLSLIPPSELPLISCVPFLPPFFSLSFSRQFFRRYISHSIFSHESSSYTCLNILLSRVLSPSTWFKWRLSALLEAAEEARPFRSVSSCIYSSPGRAFLSALPRALLSLPLPISSSIFSFRPEADLTFSLEHSPL